MVPDPVEHGQPFSPIVEVLVTIAVLIALAGVLIAL
jgi:hypothetical protein